MPKLQETFFSRLRPQFVRMRVNMKRPQIREKIEAELFPLILDKLESPETLERGIEQLKQYGMDELTLEEKRKAFVAMFGMLKFDASRDYVVEQITDFYNEGQIPDHVEIACVASDVFEDQYQISLEFQKIVLKLIIPYIPIHYGEWKLLYHLPIKDDIWENIVKLVCPKK